MNYRKGRRFEYRCRDIFRKYGYVCDRKAASSPYDLLVQRDGKIVFLVECKKTCSKGAIYVEESDVKRLVEHSKAMGAKPLLAYGFNRTPVFVAFPEKLKKEGKMYKLTAEDGKTLDEFLKEFKPPSR
mgnify:CR=1 FL=1